MTKPLLLFAIAAIAATAQPRITSAVNGADFTAAVAPGSLATIFGTGLAASAGSASALPFPTTLNGASVTVNGRAATINYASPTQINFQVPAATPTGTATVVVRNGTQASNDSLVTVAQAAIGVFGYGAGRGVIQNQDFSLNGAGNPADAGSYITVYLTGVGLTTPAVANGNAAPGGPLATPQGTGTATINGVSAPLLFLGLTPGNVGLGQANLQVPDLRTGDYPLVVTLNGRASKSVLIAVAGKPETPAGFPDGATCLTGRVDSVVFSLANKTAGFADEVVIGGIRMCPTCEIKPPLAGPFVQRLDEARENNREVDVCHFRGGLIEWLRVRR